MLGRDCRYSSSDSACLRVAGRSNSATEAPGKDKWKAVVSMLGWMAWPNDDRLPEKLAKTDF